VRRPHAPPSTTTPAPTPRSSSPADGGEKPPVFTDAGLDDAKPPTGPAEVFGHSGTTLYRLDPDTRAAQTVGTFSGCNEPSEAVLDIALDEKSAMFGTTRTGLFKIDKATAKCTKIAAAVGNKEFPNSLSFVPKGTLDANSEALVGLRRRRVRAHRSSDPGKSRRSASSTPARRA
jgi:hypothetical protein